MSVVLATQEAKIRRILVRSQLPANSVQEILSRKNPSQKKVGGVAQEVECQLKKKKIDGVPA
jgi:hypothetical protein